MSQCFTSAYYWSWKISKKYSRLGDVKHCETNPQELGHDHPNPCDPVFSIHEIPPFFWRLCFWKSNCGVPRWRKPLLRCRRKICGNDHHFEEVRKIVIGHLYIDGRFVKEADCPLKIACIPLNWFFMRFLAAKHTSLKSDISNYLLVAFLFWWCIFQKFLFTSSPESNDLAAEKNTANKDNKKGARERIKTHFSVCFVKDTFWIFWCVLFF